MAETWVSIPDAAKAEKVTTQDVEKWVSAGRIPSRVDGQGRREVRLGGLEFMPGTMSSAGRTGSGKPVAKGILGWVMVAVLLAGAVAAGWWAMDTAAVAKNQVFEARTTTAGVASQLWDATHALRVERDQTVALTAELAQQRAETARLQSKLAAAQRRIKQLEAEPAEVK